MLVAGISSCSSDGHRTAQEVTFNSVIAPLIHKQCSPCHHAGAGGPFDLITYDDIVRHAPTIRLTVKERIMPPWPADPSYRHFHGEKVLSDSEIATICEWIDRGMPEGDPSKRPSAPFFHGSTVGKPDLIVRLSDIVRIAGDNKDRFYMMKVPIELDKDTFLRLIEIVPDNKKLVHHINGHLVRYADGKKSDLHKGVPYVDTEEHDKRAAYELLDLANDDGSY
ncbi:MAG: hypothetical protein ACKO7B_02275, partial [Flavobacteriales bacterium]